MKLSGVYHVVGGYGLVACRLWRDRRSHQKRKEVISPSHLTDVSSTHNLTTLLVDANESLNQNTPLSIQGCA
jgi:hypothetical protein